MGNYLGNSYWTKAQKENCHDQLQQMSLNLFLLILNPLCGFHKNSNANPFCGLLETKTFFKRKNNTWITWSRSPWPLTFCPSGCILSILAFNLPFSKKVGVVKKKATYRKLLQLGGRQRLLNPEHLVVLSAGPIPHNSIHLLIITTHFVALY